MKYLKTILLAIGVMALSSALLLALLSLIFGKAAVLPKGLVPTITTGIGCLSALLGGFLSVVCRKEKGILWGLISGGIMLLCIAAVSLLIDPTGLTIAGAGKGAAVLISGAIGGILGVNRKSRVKF